VGQFELLLKPFVKQPITGLYELIGMARASETWDKFYRVVDRTFDKVNTTMALQLND